MADIFLSYAGEDFERARPIAESLERLGWTVFWDLALRGRGNSAAIPDAELKDAACVVVLWSVAALQFRRVIDEADQGRDRSVLVPALIEDVVLLQRFRAEHVVRLIDWRGSRDDPEFARFVAEIERLVPRDRSLRGRAPAAGTPGASPTRRNPSDDTGAAGSVAVARPETTDGRVERSLETRPESAQPVEVPLLVGRQRIGVRASQGLQPRPIDWSAFLTGKGFRVAAAMVVLLGGGMYAAYRRGSQPAESPASANQAADARASAPASARPKFRPDAWYLPDEPLLGFVEIPAGPFLMGTARPKDATEQEESWDKTGAQGRLDLPVYYVGRYEVTVAQFRAYVDAVKVQPRENGTLEGPGDNPVRQLSWHETVAYCQWLEGQLERASVTPAPLRDRLRQGWHLSLPSEAEWEKAARGTDGRIYPWGNEIDKSYANYGGDAIKPVGSYATGLSPFGVLDLSGNVSEWTRSLHRNYPYDPLDGREDLSATGWRSLRGGAFSDDTGRLRAAYRHGSDPEIRGAGIGFRVAFSRLRP